MMPEPAEKPSLRFIINNKFNYCYLKHINNMLHFTNLVDVNGLNELHNLNKVKRNGVGAWCHHSQIYTANWVWEIIWKRECPPLR